MWVECEAQPHTEESELIWDLYGESHAPRPCVTFRRAYWPSPPRPSPRPRVQTSGGGGFPQSGTLPALGTSKPLLQLSRTQAGFCFESRRHHRVIPGQVRTAAIRRAQNSCTGCQSPGGGSRMLSLFVSDERCVAS